MMQPKVLDKIKKLLALGKSSNPHEAALALQRAYELMEKHGLSFKDVELSSVGKMEAEADVAQKPPVYANHLAHGIASLFGCAIFVGYRSKGWKVGGTLNFVGMEPHHEICTYAFDVTYRKLLKARSEFLKTIPKRTKPHNKSKRADAFALGWSIEILSKVAGLVPKTELPSAVEAWMGEQGFVTTAARGLKSRGKRAQNDAILGVIKASGEQIHAGMGNGGVERLKLG